METESPVLEVVLADVNNSYLVYMFILVYCFEQLIESCQSEGDMDHPIAQSLCALQDEPSGFGSDALGKMG